MTAGSYRASDADRDQVTEVLNSAFAEGRLTLDEHQERRRPPWRRRPSTT